MVARLVEMSSSSDDDETYKPLPLKTRRNPFDSKNSTFSKCSISTNSVRVSQKDPSASQYNFNSPKPNPAIRRLAFQNSDTPSSMTDDSSSDFPLAQRFLSTRHNDISDSDDSSDDDAPLVVLQVQKTHAPSRMAPRKPVATRGAPTNNKRSMFAHLLGDSSSDDDSSSSDDDNKPLVKLHNVSNRNNRRRPAAKLSNSTRNKKRKRSMYGSPKKSTKRRRVSRGYAPMAERVTNPNMYEVREIEPLHSEKGAVKWWDLPAHSGDQKWETLEHNGVVFAPPYEPHGVKMRYDGMPIELAPEQEECATWFAAILETDHASNPVFCKNFFDDWKRLLRNPKAKIRRPELVDFAKCDFRPIFNWCVSEKEKLKLLRKEAAYKVNKKAEKKMADETYGIALVDHIIEKVGNYKVEPPGLFRGRGAHPKTGRIKKRLWPEDIILNIGKSGKIPKCPIEGHNWGGIIHDNTVTYIAKWVENINSSHKMVYLHSSSRFKGQADIDKYNKARKLKKHIKTIRNDYTRKLTSSSLNTRQLASAVWMIDILSIRVGNEKDTEESADTVGVCSLRVEHITLHEESLEIEFDFLGKDSMRYYNKVRLPDLVFANMLKFVRKKGPTDQLFDTIDPSTVNQYLQRHMEELTAKVFRTYNASITLESQLDKAFDKTYSCAEIGGKLSVDSHVDQKVYFYNQANKRVAILCNHQKTVSKNFAEQMDKLGDRIQDKNKALKKLKKELKWSQGKGNPETGWRSKTPQQVKKSIEKMKAMIRKLELNQKMKDENKKIALGTSKINYMDPRITIAFAKKMELPIEKVFSKSLMDKFPWACAQSPDFKF